MQIFRFRWIIKPLAAGLLPCLLMPASYAQTPGAQTPAPTALPIPPASGATGKFTEFDVASVRENKTNAQMNSNFPMGPGNVFIPSGGLFHATSVPLLVYIYFAYKLTGVQASAIDKELPEWVKSTRYDVEARVDGNPTKDDMRMMMRALLAERFKFKMHMEMQEVQVYDLYTITPGVTGQKLRAHPANDPSCPNEVSTDVMQGKEKPPVDTADGFPGVCGGILGMEPSGPGRFKLGARNIPLQMLASALSDFGQLGRPVIDKTGLTGNFDFTFEFTPDNIPAGANFKPDPDGPPFNEAMTKQLGLKIKADKATVENYVFDHIDRPTEN